MLHKSRYIIPFIILSILITSCTTPERTYNVLLITGGKKIEHEALLHMFDQMNGVSYTELIQPEANNIYASEEVKKYDALVFYDYVQEITEQQKRAFLQMLEKGKGIVFLHHSLVSYQDWSEYEKVIGGRYYNPTKSKDTTQTQRSTYKHDVELPVHIVDTNHPVTQNMTDFTIHDEAYGNYFVSPDVQPILTTHHPDNDTVIAWTNRYGNSRIVYIQLGHDHFAYENPNYIQLLQQAIGWVSQ